MVWSDTPPSMNDVGDYRIRYTSSGIESVAHWTGSRFWTTDSEDSGEFEVGQRIPSNAKLIELQRKADELDRIHAVWGLRRTDSPDGGTTPNAETDTTLD
jgi:hypothetical protein